LSKVTFKLNRAGVREILQSAGVQDMLRAEAVGRAPEGCVVDVFVGENRANARITAETEQAVRDNYRENTLLKALGGGG
jgi:hypothetical protein